MNKRTGIIAGASALAVLVLWFLLLWQPKGDELTKAQERQATAQAQVEQLESQLARLQSVQQQAPALLARQDKLRSAVPEDASLPQFILDANDAAIDSGVDFISISPSKPQPSTTGAGPAEIALTINISGGYFQVLDFVNQLDELPRVVVIDSINVTTGDAVGGAPVLTVGLSGRMFTTQVPTVAGAVSPPSDSSTTTTTPASTTEAPPTTNVAVTQ